MTGFVRNASAVVFLLALAVGCARGPKPDAYGNFETDEVVVGAETSGRVTWFGAVEGQPLAAGASAVAIDTTQLVLDRSQAMAQRAAAQSRVVEAQRQVEALSVQLEISKRTHERTERLFAEQAATVAQRDQAERDYRMLTQQIGAVRAQVKSTQEDAAAAEARVAQIAEHVTKSRVRNPVGGTVLATYAKAGEYVQPAQPLYRIADLDSMTMRAYVLETDLSRLKIGQPVTVSVDAGKRRRRTFPGTITWVSSEAEFTPTPIQTREERAGLVYAVKIRVPNPDGALKIGMPADVSFAAPTASR